MERFQDRVREQLGTTLEIRYKSPPGRVKKRATTRDSARVVIPVRSTEIKQFDVGARLGVSDYLENELVWGANWWGKTANVSRVEELFTEARREGEEVKVARDMMFGGISCYLSKSLSPSEIRSRGEENLIEEMAADLFDVYERVLKVAEKIDRDDVGVSVGEEGMFDKLGQYFAAQGFHFTPHQLATFYTALKTKGFVILSGLSGTGKTKLAQLFAELMTQTIEKRNEKWHSLYTALADGLRVVYDAEACDHEGLVIYTFEGEGMTAGGGEIPIPTEHRRELVARNPSKVIFRLRRDRFVPVRPDWRDSKSLLGYFNPLTDRFETTAFLRFILRAREEYREHREKAYPYFVILDEMNLARVEYYFADFLSVLESGRDDNGWTKEAIVLHDFGNPIQDADGIPIRAEIELPPNLYFAGTVNVDETTYMFSPKVLDRAFTIEFIEVDFERYPAGEGERLSGDELESLRQQLLKDFIQGGKFAAVDKEQVKGFTTRHPRYSERLGNLKSLLQPYDLHFAYRVFDEVIAFTANAEGSPVFEGFGWGEGEPTFERRLDDAFDTAVLMKVLPKFHGPRGKLEKPLLGVLAWALNPDRTEAGVQDLEKAVKDENKRLDLIRRLRALLDTGTTETAEPAEGAPVKATDFAYPRTALKVMRMLHALYTTGFASFA